MGIEELIGSLPDGWEYSTLGETCAKGGGEVQTGPFGTQLHASEYVPVGIPSIMPQNIGDNRIVLDGIARITPEDAERLSRYRVRPGDIVYSRRGDVERRALIRSEEDGWLCGTGCLRVRFGEGYVNPRYASYYLGDKRVREWIVRHAHGATMPNLNTGILSDLPFVIPPTDQQRAIGDVLGGLDDKIALNRRMNETLEAIAGEIFKDWFVDFGPTRAKAEGRGPYLAAKTWALFPDKLDDEDRPEGWKFVQLAEIAEQCKGSISPSSQPSRLYEHFSLPAFDSGQAPAADLGESIKSNKTPVPNGAVLLSKLNPEIPRVWIPNEPGEAPQIASTEFLVFKAKAPAGRGLLYCLFRSSGFRQTLEGMVTGTSKSHQRISPPAVLETEVLSGSRDTLEAFEMVVAPLLAGLLANQTESCTLSQTRDILLPKLMSGEIRLREAAKIVEAVA